MFCSIFIIQGMEFVLLFWLFKQLRPKQFSFLWQFSSCFFKSFIRVSFSYVWDEQMEMKFKMKMLNFFMPWGESTADVQLLQLRNESSSTVIDNIIIGITSKANATWDCIVLRFKLELELGLGLGLALGMWHTCDWESSLMKPLAAPYLGRQDTKMASLARHPEKVFCLQQFLGQLIRLN